jgi:AraC-like DNA-binding protein
MTLKKVRFYKYLTVDEDTKRWGIHITGAGHINVGKNTVYPLADDPSHHYFHWSTGRRLSDYQILYITKGEGVFETEITGQIRINTGDIFILFPGIWHRFTPDIDTGWEEYWVEFNGVVIRHFVKMDFLSPGNPVVKVGINEDIAGNFLEIIKLIHEEKPGFQFIASGSLVKILGHIFTSVKFQTFEGSQIENNIKQARLILNENLHSGISQKELASSVGLGYSLFRKKFKEYTGVAPNQYLINLRINKAKDLLLTTNKPLKEIALVLGFESTDYFYRLFRKKTGLTPSYFRDRENR